MKRDVFRRGVRMTHRFSELESMDDPLGIGTFDPRFPERVDNLSKRGSSPPLEIQQKGEHMYREPSSPVCKPSGGYANINGPVPDMAQTVGMPIPVGTKRRLGPLKTDK